MPPDLGANPPSPSPTPHDKLIRNIRELEIRIVRGKAAAKNYSVFLQRFLSIASIVLAALGSAGVIADKLAGNLPSQTGFQFWGSIILLVFGVLSQIADKFAVGQRSADSESLAVRCGMYETRLTDVYWLKPPSQPLPIFWWK